jgi:hemolysin activation/secretion protein
VRRFKVATAGLAWLAGSVFGTLSLTLPGSSFAQAPQPLVLPLLLPQGAAKQLRVERIVFAGRSALGETVLQDVARSFLQRSLRYDDLEELRQRLIAAHVERGYVSSGALLERFDADTGLLQVRIVEGQVAVVQVTGAGGLSDAYIARRLTRTGETFNVRVLEDRFRALLVDPLFSRLDVRVLPGEALGQTVLAVEATRASPVELGVFANNHQAPSVGANAVGADLTVRNLSGWGDTATALLSRNRGGLSSELSWSLPILAGRTLLGARATHTHSSVVEEPLAQLDVDSVVRGHEISLTHPLIDDGGARWLVGALHAERRNSTTLGGEPFSFVAGEDSGLTRVRSERLFTEWTQRAGSRIVLLRTTYSWGRNNLPDPAVLPEQAPRRFQVLLAQGQLVWPLGEGGSQLLGRLSAQATGDRLLPLEQFALGGRQTVRGYRENQLVRDRGWNASAEWRTPVSWGAAAWQQLTLGAFIDGGAAANVGGPSNSLASVGLGLGWQFNGLDLDVQWGHALRDAPGSTSGSLQDRGVHLSLRWRAK